mgnify:CR=1 FL=1
MDDLTDDVDTIDIKDTEELTKATAELAKVKKEAGIEEGAIDPAEYGDIGKGYLSGFNKPHSLNDDDLETLGCRIVKQLYKGDFKAAKAKACNYCNAAGSCSQYASLKSQGLID